MYVQDLNVHLSLTFSLYFLLSLVHAINFKSAI